MVRHNVILGLLCGLFSISSFAASDLYVSTNGSDSNPGTQSAPLRTIQKASALATAGTTVHVASGTYSEIVTTTQSGTSSARIRYISDVKWGAKVVPPSSSSSDTIWWSKGAYTDVIGFDIDGSNASSKILMGLYLSGSYSSAQGNHVHHIASTSAACTGNGGAGLEAESWYGGTNIDVIGNVVHNIGYSGCSYIQGIYQTSSGKIINNLVYAVGAYAIHLWHDANHVDILNNTVFGSGFGMVVGGGDFVHTSGPADYVNVANNIIFDNGGGIDEEGSTGAHNTYTNNLVFQNSSYNWRLLTSSHSGDVAADPQFVNYIRSGGGDYHLKSTSPAIDRGTSSRAPATDISGAPRPQGAGYDIGAYEYGAGTPAPTLAVSVASVDFGSVVLGSSSSVKAVVMKNTGTAPLSFMADFAISSGFSGSGDCSTSVPLNPGTTCTLNMKFTPSKVGLQTGSLVIRTNAADSPKSVPLSGSGVSSTPAPTTSWVRCASEGQTCKFSGTRTVRYGAKGVYKTKVVTSSVPCTNTAFGGDPIVGYVKACDYSSP